MGDDGVLRGGRPGDFGVAGRQGLPAGRRGGESGRRRHQLCRCGCAAGNGRCLQALAFAGLLLMVLRALGGRCLGSGLLGRLVLDVLGLRTPHDAQRVDAEGQFHADGQGEGLQRLLGRRQRLGDAGVLQCGGAHVHLAEARGAIPQSSQLPGHVHIVECHHQLAASVAAFVRALAGPDQPVDMATLAHRAAHALGLQRHGGGHVALDDAQHRRQRLVARRPVPDSATNQSDQQDQPEDGPGAPACSAAGCTTQSLAPRQRGGSGTLRGSTGSTGSTIRWTGKRSCIDRCCFGQTGGLHRISRHGRARIRRGTGRLCHQNVNPRFMCSRTFLLWMP